MARKPRLGSGERFKEVEKEAAEHGAKNPRAVAAAVGMRKYGKRKMRELAKRGKRRAVRRHHSRHL
jgi:hypothetical protein